MNTQEQAYINGFVKRANQYGLTSNEALALLKEASSLDFINSLKENISSLKENAPTLINNAKENIALLKENAPTLINNAKENIASLQDNTKQVFDTISKDPNIKAIGDSISNVYKNEVFRQEHPNLYAVKSFLTQHNIDPQVAGLTLGGAGLLAGGYGLAKLLNRKPKNNNEL